jgi:CRP-like cAMP-binding protein
MNVATNTSRLLQRLTRFVSLSAEEMRALEAAAGPARLYRPHEDLTREGENAAHVGALVSGFACRYRMLPDGRRQIVSYLIPGDLCDVRHLLLPSATHTVSTLTAANVALFGRDTLLGLIERYPRIGQALYCIAWIEELIAREWLVNVGQRTAIERLAHLLCEIFARMHAVQLTDRGRCELPLTQVELADALALSTVHVNRTLQELRRKGLVSLSGGMLEIHDLGALQALAIFTGDYLQPGRIQQEPAQRRLAPR